MSISLIDSTEILFEEIIRNEKDLDLFLKLYHGFPGFYLNLCRKYTDRVFLPGLQSMIAQYNEECSPNTPLKIYESNKDALKPPSAEMMTSTYWFNIRCPDFWPGNMNIRFGSDGRGRVAAALWIGLGHLDQASEPLRAALKQSFKKHFPPVSSYGDGFFIWNNYAEPYKAWNTPETFPGLVKEFFSLPEIEKDNNISRSNLEFINEKFPLAGHYLSDLRKLISIVDSAVRNDHGGK
jgi:hypothetical protein